MSITVLISLLNLNKNNYFNRTQVKENTLYILPKEDSYSYLSTKEIIRLHDTLEPFRDIYNIDFSFEQITIKAKSEFYE